MTSGGGARVSPGRKVVLALLLVVLLVAAGLVLVRYLPARTVEQVGYRVTRDVAPLDILRPDDVVLDAHAPTTESLVTRREDAVGHYLLSGLRADQPLPRRLVGPAAAADLQPARVVLVAGGFAVSLNGRLAAGDRSDILFTGSPPGTPELPSISRALVLDVESPRPDFWIVTLAIRTDSTAEQIARLAAGAAYLVKVPA